MKKSFQRLLRDATDIVNELSRFTLATARLLRCQGIMLKRARALILIALSILTLVAVRYHFGI